MSITDDDIKRLRALEMAATPGPWDFTTTTIAPVVVGFVGPDVTDYAIEANGRLIVEARNALPGLLDAATECARLFLLRPASDYHEDYGNVIWWRLPINEPPWVGTSNDDDFVEDYYTHFSPLPWATSATSLGVKP